MARLRADDRNDLARRSGASAYPQAGKRTLVESRGAGASGPPAPPPQVRTERRPGSAAPAEDKRSKARAEEVRTGVQWRMAPDAAGGPRELSGSASPVQAAAERGIAGSSHPLPYVDAIQPLFGGHDLDAIQAHTDGNAAAGARHGRGGIRRGEPRGI